MTKNTKFVGLDVDAATVAIAAADDMGGEVRSLGTVAHELSAIVRVLGKLGKSEQLRVCYEAGPTGSRFTGSSRGLASSAWWLHRRSYPRQQAIA